MRQIMGTVLEFDGCTVRPRWPLEQCLQLCPQAVVRLLLAQTDLLAHSETFPHQYLWAVTPLQVKEPDYILLSSRNRTAQHVWGKAEK